MPFEVIGEVNLRLGDNSSRLTDQEFSDLIRFVHQLTGGPLQRLKTELSLRHIEAIQEFEKSSSKLSSRISWLTLVLLFLTFVIAGFTIALYIQGNRNTTLLERFEKEPIPIEAVAEPVDPKDVIPKQEVMEEEAEDKTPIAPPKEKPKPVD